MPVYEVKIGEHTYDVNSENDLTDAQAYASAKIQADNDLQAERDHLQEASAKPSRDEITQAPTGSMWDGMVDAGKGLGYGLLNTVAHPLDTAVGMVKAQGREFGKAYDEATGGKPGGNLAAAGHLGAGLFPLLGPMAANVGEDLGESSRDPRALGRAVVNGGLLLGPSAVKGAVKAAPRAIEIGTKLATDHPGAVGAVAGGIEGYHMGGWPGAAAGAIGLPTGIKAITSLIRDTMKKGEEGAKTPTTPVAPRTTAEGAKAAPKATKSPNGAPKSSGRDYTQTPAEEMAQRQFEENLSARGIGPDDPLPSDMTNGAPKPTSAAPKPINRPSRSKAARGKENGYSANDEIVAKAGRDEGLTGSEVHERVIKERAARRGPNYDKKKADAAKPKQVSAKGKSK